MAEPTKTMSPTLTSLIESFHTAQATKQQAEQDFVAATAIADAARDAALAAKAAVDRAQAAMQAGFLQEVDPMPLVPAPRPMDKWTFTLDARSIMGHAMHRAIDASMIVDGTIKAGCITASQIRA